MNRRTRAHDADDPTATAPDAHLGRTVVALRADGRAGLTGGHRPHPARSDQTIPS
jgi:hypothetical protein